MATILDTIGNTPMVQIQRLNPNPNVTVYAKLEGNNPGGSVKDRPALNIIRSAWERGDINTSSKLIEATSGNTGIAMALIASLYGIRNRIGNAPKFHARKGCNDAGIGGSGYLARID